MPNNKPVAITGVGCLCALGLNMDACMAGLFQNGIQPARPVGFTSTHATGYPVFEITDPLPPVENSVDTDLLRTNRLALIAVEQALEDAGLTVDQLREKRVGVCIGTTVGSSLNSESFYRQYKAENKGDMQRIRRYLNNNPAALIARYLALDGPSQTVVNACSSGTDAIGIGAAWIRAGLCDLVISGGADELCRTTYNGFIALKITADASCKPFDRNRKGLNLGEGAAILILESDKMVRERNKAARAFSLGYGAACDAYHLTAPRPDGTGLQQAVRTAVRQSAVNRNEIAFVNAHGTGTPDNDRVESRVLDENLPGIPFLSTKGYTGHTLGAAGAIEAAFTIGCLKAGKIPANRGFETPDPELPAVPVTRITDIHGTAAISQSLAFGGNNAVLILGKA